MLAPEAGSFSCEGSEICWRETFPGVQYLETSFLDAKKSVHKSFKRIKRLVFIKGYIVRVGLNARTKSLFGHGRTETPGYRGKEGDKVIILARIQT